MDKSHCNLLLRCYAFTTLISTPSPFTSASSQKSAALSAAGADGTPTPAEGKPVVEGGMRIARTPVPVFLSAVWRSQMYIRPVFPGHCSKRMDWQGRRSVGLVSLLVALTRMPEVVMVTLPSERHIIGIVLRLQLFLLSCREDRLPRFR